MEHSKRSIAQTNTRSIRLLSLGGIFVLLLTIGIGGVVYWSTQSLVRSSQLVVHTEEVLNTLQSISQRIDRLETGIHLYQHSKSDSDYRAAELTVAGLQSSMNHLKHLVEDSPVQTARAITLSDDIDSLTRQLGILRQGSELNGIVSTVQCRKAVAEMGDEERSLLDQRTKQTAHESGVSLFTGIASAVTAGLVEVLLFGLLIRDAVRHRRASETILHANQLLEEREQETLLLAQAREEFQLCLSAQQAYIAIEHFACRIFPDSSGAFSRINNSRQMVERVLVWGDPTSIQESFPLDACCGLRSGHARWRDLRGSIAHCAHFSSIPPQEYACIPMNAQSEAVGIVHLQSVCNPSPKQIQSLNGLLELAAMAIANLSLRHKLENQSVRDPLTKLFNRRFMESSLERELSRAARQYTSLAVFMIDADHFKHFNDNFGHEAGDHVLRAVAELFRKATRAEDVVCRYGGEEFVILLPDISKATAVELAETIRNSACELELYLGDEKLREITVSIGIAMYPDEGATVDDLVRAADKNLYEAKRRGRNRTVATDTTVLLAGYEV